jgi:TctA family transporter
VVSFVLGPLMEENFRRSMVLSRGDPMIFVYRPLSPTMLALAAASVMLIVLPQVRKTREEAFQE